MSDDDKKAVDVESPAASKSKSKSKGKDKGKDKEKEKEKEKDTTTEEKDTTEEKPKGKRGRKAKSKKGKKKTDGDDKKDDSAPTPVKVPKPKKEGALVRTGTMDKTLNEGEAYLARVEKNKKKREAEDAKSGVSKKPKIAKEPLKIKKKLKNQKVFEKGERSSSRDKKEVERFEVDTSKEPKEIVFVDGKGVRLEDIKSVRKALDKVKLSHEGIAHLHYILYGRKGHKGENFKSHILKWSGINPSTKADKEAFIDKVDRRFVGELRDICEALGIAAIGNKPDLVDAVARFLIKPDDFTPDSDKKEKKDKKSKKSKKDKEKKEESSDSESSESEDDKKDKKRKSDSSSDSEPDAKRRKTEEKGKEKEPELPSDSKITKKAKEIYKKDSGISSKEIIKQLSEHFKVDVSSKKALIKEAAPSK